MVFIDEGIETFTSEKHPSKALLPIDFTVEEIETLESEEHP